MLYRNLKKVVAYQKLSNTCQPAPPAERLSNFPNLDAVKAHVHGKHRLGPESKRVIGHQSTKCYTKYQELIKEGIDCRGRHNSF
jgi:hypothetical protein